MALKLSRAELLPGQKRMSIGAVAADVGTGRSGSCSRCSRILWMLMLALKNAEQQTTTYFSFSPTWSNFATVLSEQGHRDDQRRLQGRRC